MHQPRSLASTLALATIAPTFLALAVSVSVRLPRESHALLSDTLRDQRSLAAAIGGAAEEQWHSQGAGEALEVIEDAAARTPQPEVRFVPLDELGDDERSALVARRFFSRVGQDDERAVTLYALRVNGQPQGAVSVSEALTEREDYLLATVVRSVMILFALGGLLSGAALVIARRRIVRPLEELLRHADRIGRGDFRSWQHPERGDEIGDLARALNDMGTRLAALRDRAEEESAAHLQAVEELRHADRLSTIGKLASGLAHELGTPLHVVMARARRIAKRAGGHAADRTEAEQILADGERMARLVRQLLDFARGPERRRDDVQPNALLDDALRLVEPLASARGVTLARAGSLPETTLRGDREGLLQVLTNLLVNAVLASAAGQQVRLRAAVDESGALRLSVEDDGVGMTDDVRAHLFEPFFTTRPTGEGSGLGLSVAWGIVADHDGHITVESAPSRGSRFTVTLPGTATVPLSSRAA